jgi:hypothetical protein
MSETTILVVLGIKLAIVVFGRAGDWRNLVVDFSLTESIPTSGRRPIEGQAPHPRRGPADRGREARGGSEGADPHQPIREADIYLLAVDESALAVPTNSLGPMSEIAQFSNQKWALTSEGTVLTSWGLFAIAVPSIASVRWPCCRACCCLCES